MGKDRVMKSKSYIAFLLLSCSAFLFFPTCFLFRPPSSAYNEIKRIGITIDENSLCILADIGNVKNGHNVFLAGFAIFQNDLAIQANISMTSFYIGDTPSSLVFFIPLEDWFYNYHSIKINDNYYIRDESYATPRLFVDFLYGGRLFNSIRIEFEHTDNKYKIKKIGDFLYDDSASMTGISKGSGFLEEGVEYLIVFYPPYNHHYRSPGILPARFSIINGIPIIRLVN
jgi:hypothetical protein